ncbi:hypothetical protein A2368_04525 [Candidatus Collierbacteria bacterium RIFOXYB1_FULL_49_13]|uniref:DUF4012 domain-containing protein n=1 Tax=Candidatus Collierbacteria bacterium RIFOXYB1_FULL_49_13 TaxID=1817728 RepID=A0A1F5FH20_9BACT|nr:MAG: hypothetical protein A2368_04525 [Candidatus Collierbacteria bacterium RIFOXYB1_FULL_49_13]
MELKPLDLSSPEDNPPATASHILLPPKKSRIPKPLLIIGAVVLVLLLTLGVTGLLAFTALNSLKTPAQATLTSVKGVVTAIQSQNLIEAENQITESQKHLQEVETNYKRFSFVRLIPFVSAYYNDGLHGLNAGKSGLEAGTLFVKAIEPYADILGLKVKDGAAVDITSAEDRIVFLVQTLDAISPQLDEIATKLKDAEKEFSQINPNRYPSSIGGQSIRSRLIEAQSSLKIASETLTEAKPLISLLPELLGQSGEKTYMLLFQNDAEIRPTGGFMTAYAYIKVIKGKITPLDSYDIYQLDSRFTKNVPAPDVIKKYLEENVWHLRNMNISPDFRVSMDTFTGFLRDIPGNRAVDGIIAMDTQVPVKLIEILGPIGVGGWGNFTAEIDKRCDCAQVIYALEEIADKPTNKINEGRKAVLGPLMHSIMANAMGSPKSSWPKLVNAGIDMIRQKHVLMYFFDSKLQTLAESFNAAGRITPAEGDYLHINGANFGGAKSNMFVKEQVEQDYEISDSGEITKTVTVSYNNPYPGSDCNLERGGLCLNGRLRQYVRFYVPKGSTLVEMIGSEVAATSTEDLGKTVFEGFFTLRPQSQSKLVVKYKLPGTYTTPLPLTIQKQPGTGNIIHNIVFNGQPQTVELNTDVKLQLQ